jgi:thioredoxin-like negative regulator of GroEL
MKHIQQVPRLVLRSGISACLGLLACAVLASLAAGCGEDPSMVTSNNSNMIFINGEQEFHQKVELSDKPVMVEFFKASCPTCVLQEGWMNELAEEYKGRVVFARMWFRDGLKSVCPEVSEKYHLFWVPTEILFVGGQEKQRWNGPWNYPKDVFREGINDALLEQARPKGVGAQPTASPAASIRSASPAMP